jgi:hypothetical protein
MNTTTMEGTMNPLYFAEAIIKWAIRIVARLVIIGESELKP